MRETIKCVSERIWGREWKRWGSMCGQNNGSERMMRTREQGNDESKEREERMSARSKCQRVVNMCERMLEWQNVRDYVQRNNVGSERVW